MSGEIKILFYIIAGIIYIISTFYSKEKKKQNQRNVSKKPVNSKTAEDIFRELKKSLSIPEEIVKENQPPEPGKIRTPLRQSEALQKKKTKVTKTVQPIENTFIQEGHPDQHKVPEIHEIRDNSDNKPEIDFTETDPRKALIFGEIFKRPQY